MNHPRSAPATVVVDSVLWAFGGYDGNNVFRDTAEWFDIQTDEIACRADPDCVETLADWFAENANGQHDGTDWGTMQHPAGTKDDTLDPNMINGRRRRLQPCPADFLTSGLTAVATVCNGANGVPTGCMEDCAVVFNPYWAQCENDVTTTLPAVAVTLQPLAVLCANPTHGFDELAEQNGPAIVVPPAADCAPGDLVCVENRVNGDTTGATEAPHICGDDCAGTWHMLDERMGTRRAYACAVAIDNDQDGDKEIFVIGGKSGNYVFLSSVDVFDIDTRTWSTIPDMPQPRWGLGCAATAGRIFAVGGRRGNPEYLDTMDVYTPGDATTMGSWRRHASIMKRGHAFFGLVVIIGDAHEEGELMTPYRSCAPVLASGPAAQFTHQGAIQEFFSRIVGLAAICMPDDAAWLSYGVPRACSAACGAEFFNIAHDCHTIMEHNHEWQAGSGAILPDLGGADVQMIIEQMLENCDPEVYDHAAGEFVPIGGGH